MRNLALAGAACVILASAGSARAEGGVPRYARTIDMASRPIDVRLEYGNAAPGSAALQGEGELRTRLPGGGYVALRIPHTVGQVVTVGDAQLAASYALPTSDSWRPELAIAALVDLPTVGDLAARPGVKLFAAKDLHTAFLRSVHLEGEVRTAGPELAPTSRVAIGTRFEVLRTTGSLQFVLLRPPAHSGTAREELAELGLAHALDPSTTVRLQLAATLQPEAASLLRASVGFDVRF